MHFDAAVFDLDGVITFTARAHAAAWTQLFDDFLRARAGTLGEAFMPFTKIDYEQYVDGRPRLDGIRTFLASRGIRLQDGSDADEPNADTVHALGNRKNTLFQEIIREHGVEVDRDAVQLIHAMRARGIHVGVASSSKNTALVLEIARLNDLFEACVNGIVSEELNLAGKPAPDIFLACLERLHAPDPRRAMVAEDALAGVEAGRAGGFGLVLGVDRTGQAQTLREHGADWVVQSFRGLTPDRIDQHFAAVQAGQNVW